MGVNEYGARVAIARPYAPQTKYPFSGGFQVGLKTVLFGSAACNKEAWVTAQKIDVHSSRLVRWCGVPVVGVALAP